MSEFSPQLDSKLNYLQPLVIFGLAIMIGIMVAKLNLGEGSLVIALSMLSIAGIVLAFFYPSWILLLLMLVVIPTTDAQISQTPVLVPGTNLPVSYVDPLVVLIFGVWIFGLTLRSRHIYRSPLNWPLALFMGTTVCSAFIGLATGARPGDVWIGLRPPIMYLLTFVAASSFTSSKQVVRFVAIIVLAIFIVAIWGIYLSVAGLGTTISTSFGILALRNFQGGQSVYLVIGLLSALGSISFVKRQWVRWTLALVSSLIGGAVLVSFVRSNWVGLMVGLLTLTIMLPRRLRMRFAVTTGLVIISLLLLMLSVVLLSPHGTPLMDVARERFLSIFIPSASTQYTYESAMSRIFELQSGLPQVLESPIVGHGYGHYFTVHFVRGESTLVRGFHNSYLTLAYTSGLIGLTAFLWLNGAFLLYAWRLSRNMPLTIERGVVTGLATACLAISVASALNFYLFDMVNISPFLGISMGLVLFLGRQCRIKHATCKQP